MSLFGQLFGQNEADRASIAAANRPPVPPSATEAAQAINRWEQDYLRSAGALDLTRGDDIETGLPGGQRAASGGGTGPAKPGPTLAELARSVSDANVYYSQRAQPPRPLPTAPEASPWVDTDASGLLRTRYGDPTQPPGAQELLPSSPAQVSGGETERSATTRRILELLDIGRHFSNVSAYYHVLQPNTICFAL